MSLGLHLGLTVGNPALSAGGGWQVRIEPATSTRHYVLFKQAGGGAEVLRVENGVGGSTVGSDFGGDHPEDRITGQGYLADANGDPAADTVWSNLDIGAVDFVARKGTAFALSYHGVGTGSLVSQTRLLNGVEYDPTVAAYGSSWELRNTLTATDGVDTVTRELIWSRAANDNPKMSLGEVTATGGFDLFYFGMVIGTGDDMTELQARYGTAWNAWDLGTSSDGARASLLDPEGVLLRSPTDGRYITLSGTMPDLAGFQRAHAQKQPSNTRSKVYAGQFSSVSALGGVEVEWDWGVGETGATASPANDLADAVWTVPPWAYSASTGGTITKSGADLTISRTSGTGNLRVSAPTQTLVAGQRASLEVDYVSRTATGAEVGVYVSLSGNSTTNPAIDTTPLLGRNINVFTTTQDSATGQRFALRQQGSTVQDTVWRNPAIRPLAA